MIRDPKRFAISLSLGAAVLMLAGKWAAFVITGSDAIFSDAAESVVHIVATLMAAYSLWYAGQPADRTHPYGHGRIAFFSAGVEGTLILVAALAILYSAIESLIEGPELERLSVGLLITAGLCAVNLALGGYLVAVGKRHGSLVLIANGYHVLTDMWTSLGVVAGISAVWLTDILWLDPAIAILLALHILRSAVALIRRAYGGLMDEADAEVTERIIACLERAVSGGQLAAFHQLRHRQIENSIWLEVHFLLPGRLTVWEAHERVNEVESTVKESLPGHEVHITSHIEPEEHHHAHPGGHESADPYAAPREAGPDAR